MSPITVAVVDDAAQGWFVGLPVRRVAWVNEDRQELERLVVMSLGDTEDVGFHLETAECPSSHVLWV